MQATAPTEEKRVIKLEQLADEITNKYVEAVHLARESHKSGAASVMAAFQCGKMLCKAKGMVPHTMWGKWLLDNCGNISERTAQRWMTLAKTTRLSDLASCRNITEAYRLCDVAKDEKREKPLGTQEVDIFAPFVQRILKLADTYGSFDLSGLPDDRKAIVREKIQGILEKL